MQTQAVAPTGPGQLRIGLGNPIKNTGNVKSGSKGEERSAEMAMKVSRIGKKTTLSVIKLAADLRRCFFSVHDVNRIAMANCNFETN